MLIMSDARPYAPSGTAKFVVGTDACRQRVTLPRPSLLLSGHKRSATAGRLVAVQRTASNWSARLLKRVFEPGHENCPNCGGEQNILARILGAPVTRSANS